MKINSQMLTSLSFSLTFVVFQCLSAVECAEDSTTSTVPHRKWISQIIMEHIWDLNLSSENNSECTQHFQEYRQHLNKFSTWALQMLDSSDFIPNGFLVGDHFQLGNFDECVEVKVPKHQFSAQYCIAAFQFHRIGYTTSFQDGDDWNRLVWDRIAVSKNRSKIPKDFFNLAFCIPSSCSAQDLEVSLQKLLEAPLREEAYGIEVTVDSLQCTTNSSSFESVGYFLVRNVLVLITIVVFLCSFLDVLLAVLREEEYNITNYSLKNASGIEKWLLPFSIYRNMRHLFTSSDNPDDHKILHGFKFILMIAVIAAHRLMEGFVNPAVSNWIYFERRFKEFSIFFIGLPVVDVFFCISGFLTCTSLTKQLEKNSFNIWTFTVNKLIRVLPPYAVVLACTVYILPGMSNGPLWKSVIEPEVEHCRQLWWTNLLFINNYYSPENYCLLQSWYIAADMHFFILGSLLVYFCWKWKPYRGTIIFAALITSIIIPFIMVIQNEYDGILKLYYDYLAHPRAHKMFINLYMKSHARAGPYIVGIAGAVILDYLKKKGHKFSKIATWTGVFMGAVLSLSAATYGYVLYNPAKSYSVIENALYAALHHHIVAAGFMIVVIIQVTTGFGFLNPLFLAHDIFLPGSKLSYWAFLLNIPAILYTVGSYRNPQYITYEQMLSTGQNWGDIALIYFVSIYFYLIIEAPINHFKPKCLNLIKQIQNSSRSKPENSSEKKSTNYLIEKK